MAEAGYKDIVGYDGSQGMLERAREKVGIYKELHQVFFGEGAFPEEQKRRFRVAVNVALLMQGHAPPQALGEMLDSLVGDEGDKLIFVIREDQFEGHGYREYLDDLVTNGRLRFVCKEQHARKTTFATYQDTLFG